MMVYFIANENCKSFMPSVYSFLLCLLFLTPTPPRINFEINLLKHQIKSDYVASENTGRIMI